MTMFEDLMIGLDEVEAFLAGKTTGYRVTLPAEVDVKAIRKRLNMTQSRFSDTFASRSTPSSIGKEGGAHLKVPPGPS
jgi:DNA-binding transcriptional regulator YiaG